MTSLLRPSAKDSSEMAAAPESDSNVPASFLDSKIFNVLGRIDEETSFRASLSNMTSQDSSPRSLKSSDESEVSDWLTPLSPEHFGNNNYNEAKCLSSDNVGSNSSNRNVTVVTTVTNIEDPKMNAATSASTERRQDRSSPTFLKAETTSISSSSSASSLPSSSSGSTRDHRHHWPQREDQQTQKGEDEEQLRRENLALERECEELESIVLQMKTEGNTLQVRTALKLKNYRTEIEQASEAKQSLQNQCRELEDKIWSLRNEARVQQEAIWDTEIKLRMQRKQQQQQQRLQQKRDNEAADISTGEK